MTQPPTSPAPTSPTTAPPPLPLDTVIYTDLCTDYYPWTEVMLDLEARQAVEFSGVLDAFQGGRWARFVWSRGQCLGGFTHGGQAVAWAQVHGALPRARLHLGGCLPLVSDVVWTSRAARAGTLGGHWPDMERRLEREQFYGLLVSGGQCSVWDTGQMLSGRLPQAGASCVAHSPHTPDTREALLNFWRDLLRRVNHSVPLDEPWNRACVRLSAEHPCLDPFLQDITLRGGVLRVDVGVSVGELRPALHWALRTALGDLGIGLGDLALGNLPQRPEWAAAGLGGAVAPAAPQRQTGRQVGR
ncbi:hypothetical protein [Deinococcus arenicola]|uniref:Uncharacterized protein n=1 Tax=Deinococcus arenicola TaxID=2994950 RepID=A0ABU4DP28_9DEIO|nr:hypothetical protein [Deinococcus sp. ZS9-10]MDV6374176.1 hypothetical protein [Deinococcus sp. ZS9-10]